VTGFAVRPWDEIEQFYEGLSRDGATFVDPMLSLTRSVVAEGASTKLAAHTSMHDLVVTMTPVSSSPDWIRVSLARDDRVRIGHETPTGPGDSIERPQAELLPLFWRFTIEKWGIRPARDSG
jgi:hypothetical protein